MKEASVAICGIVKDCAVPLVRNIIFVEKLRKLFRQSHVLIFENDSTDATKEVLTRWSRESTNVRVFLNNTGESTWPQFVDSGVHPAYSFYRISRMAGFRNKYIEYIEKNMEVDFLIIVDLDLYSFSIDGIANTFGQEVPWHGVSSNGRSRAAKRSFFSGYRFFDTYALRELADPRPQTEMMITDYQKEWCKLKPGMPMIRVASGFNGLAVYRAAAVRGARYGCESNNDPRVEVECEHVYFHRQMASHGHDLIFVNPAQLVYYNTYRQHLCDSVLRLFKGFSC